MRTPEGSEAPDAALSPTASACTSATRSRVTSRRAARAARAAPAEGRRVRSRHRSAVPAPPRDEVDEIIAELADIEEKASQTLGALQKEVDDVLSFALNQSMSVIANRANATRKEVENIVRLKEGNARAEGHEAALREFK